ncbi:MAG: hypothetical protein JSU03_02280 [Bacteroidetes bacterium]|nr:hypothetical protein [Bacteroidota bacterium]
MPQSKNRHPHHKQTHPTSTAKPKKKGQAAIAAAILFAILGLGIGYFSGGAEALPLISGAIIGAIAGYILGHQMDKVITNK